ncbi:trans-sialidase, putative [Trypanosoma cruzi marinkellei]|uniref:Trans-sialidase, putative n=1 Tax=Trypanosoma cruzi marinkellei TaxID=85056 RepID=K2N7J3_TRYCR|nr:trans-sialidase, putative [Trypanosoma cruzi marinkellei]
MMMPRTADGWLCSLFHPLLLACFLSISHSITHEEGKQALNATVKLKGSERTNSTHTPSTHTHIYMLSRVAAFMAPRTHNRRRVTGSSGRRREGRESERQRPNMSRHRFYSAVLLLLVVMMWMCCGSGGTASTQKTLSDAEPSRRKLFFWKDVEGGKVRSLYVPSLVEMNGDVFAVAQALCTKNDNEYISNGFSSKLLELSDQTKEELDKTKLNTQVPEKCSSDEGNCASLNSAPADSRRVVEAIFAKPTTVVKENDIYMLVGLYGLRDADDKAGKSGAYELGLLLARGNVSVVDGDSKKRIYWNDIDAIPSISNNPQRETLTALFGGGGSGVKMEDGTLVFPMEGEREMTTEEKKNNRARGIATVSLFLYTPGTERWTLSKGISDDGCSDPSVVKWEKGKLIMMTACDGGRRRVYESGDMGESWTEALGTLSRVWGNKHTGPDKGVRSGFITATIGDVNKKVMLVTLPVYSTENGKEDNGKGRLHLWLTDNTHIVYIGPVSEKDDDVTSSSLLYKSGKVNNEEELIALYEKREGSGEASHGMVSVRLTAQLQRVKEVLVTWKEVDERVSQLCTSLLAAKVTSTGDACSADKVTKGLVGFLSGNLSGNTWRDEYLGVNATVMSGAAAATGTSDNGVTFQGAWAEWPVGRQGENQLYHFANYNFTLVATVSIDKAPKGGSVPLMGATLNGDGNTVLLGLSYNNNGKKWQFSCGGEGPEKLSSTLGAEKTQHVVILVRSGNQGSAYVDGQRVGDASCALGNNTLQEISHFYIGGDGGSAGSREGVPVTVTNVLLYNRPLDEAVITALKNNQIFIPKTMAGNTSSSLVSRSNRSAEHLAEGATGDGGSARPGEAHGDAGTMRGSGLLPSLLLLLGLWGFAAL